MKPVAKGAAPRIYAAYGDAKPDLLNTVGAQCSYCEAGKDPQDLHVEHIYAKDPHPELELSWTNFLVSCNSCNSYKNIHFGSTRQVGLEAGYVWPHLENTFRAFQYTANGLVEVRPGLDPAINTAAEATRDMVGLLVSPAAARNYNKLGIAYDGVAKRSQLWSQAASFRVIYLGNVNALAATAIAEAAAAMGYFSIWMEVFHDRVEVRRELIRAFKADPACFDTNTQPVVKGRL